MAVGVMDSSSSGSGQWTVAMEQWSTGALEQPEGAYLYRTVHGT